MKLQILSWIKRLPGVVLIAAILATAGYYGVKRVHRYNNEGAALMHQLFEMNTLLSSKDTWYSRAEWISERIPRFDTQNGASLYLLDSLRGSSVQYGLEFGEHQIHPRKKAQAITTESFENFDRATVEVSIKGHEKDIVRWVHKIQTPGTFAGVDHIALEMDDFGMQCRLRVSQWYLGNNRSFDPTQHHKAEVHNLTPSLAESF
ncbi:MAG: hypothetical protein P1U89_05095 [Verrucomicrobiales bacterium]|nr:hypothetical protein [Verrucomicrobiales bacterium]